VIFARDGFLNSTIAEIMKEAQRSIGVFYRYYKSKDELLLELTEEFRQKLLHQIHMPLQPKQDPIKNFEEKLGTFWQLYADDWAIVNSALPMSMVDEAFAKRWHDLRRQGIVAITHVISKAKKLGYCPTIDPHYAASALCSMLEFTCYNWTSRWGDFAGAKKMSKGTAVETLKQIAAHSIAWRTPE
jgi:AcrR family transcriptional regulator